jgi:hypothetical protein
MHAVSFDKEALNITIHNQHPDLELTSPVYCSKNAICSVPPNQKTDADSTMEASFGIDSKQKDVKGALLYELQRKYATRIDDQSNSSIVSIKDIVTNIHLFVAWFVEGCNHRFCICLIEFTGDFIWDEDKLWTLYKGYSDQLYENYKSDIITWLMHDGTIMKTRRVITYRSDYKLDIIISEGTGKYNVEEPIKIAQKRLVLSSLMLIVLTYIASLSEGLLFRLNIHNQCSNVDLISPIYNIGEGLEWYKSPGHGVCAGNTMRSSFIIKSQYGRVGALIYRLQKWQTYKSTEISEDTSSTVQLLVIWEFSEFEGLCANVLLLEHDKKLEWDEDDLERLYHKNIDQYRLYSRTVIERWLLNDNNVLKTRFEVMNEDRTLNIIISKVKINKSMRTQVFIHPIG